MPETIDRKKILLFLGLTFAADWLMAGLFYLFGGRLNTTPAVFMALAYMFVPMIMAVVVQRFIYHQDLKGAPGHIVSRSTRGGLPPGSSPWSSRSGRLG